MQLFSEEDILTGRSQYYHYNGEVCLLFEVVIDLLFDQTVSTN